MNNFHIFALKSKIFFEPITKYNRLLKGYFRYESSRSVNQSKFKPITLSHLEWRERFDSVFPEVVQTITEAEHSNEIPQIEEWLQKLLEYNLREGKKNRGLRTVMVYHMLSPQMDEVKLKLASMLGWCVELLQAFYLVHDDIIDGATLRRGRPCWYRLKNNGLNAINDGVLLENSIYKILQKYFKNEPFYVNIMETFHDVTMKTSIGQLLDAQASNSFKLKKEFDHFTFQNYAKIVEYKTAIYSFRLPVTLAMYMAGVANNRDHETATNILLKIGQYYQVQDDYLDCFGEKKAIGKSGNDITEGKCTWLIVNALHRASEKQKSMLQENYGKPDPWNTEIVEIIYNECGLKEIYNKYENYIFDELMLEIERVSNEIPTEIFKIILSEIFRRKH